MGLKLVDMGQHHITYLTLEIQKLVQFIFGQRFKWSVTEGSYSSDVRHWPAQALSLPATNVF